MNQYWSRRIREAVPYTPGEQPKNRKFIKLNTNECPYPPSPRAAEAIRGAAGGAAALSRPGVPGSADCHCLPGGVGREPGVLRQRL